MIVIGGMIASGKSTFAAKLSEELGTELFVEPVEDNPILAKYYRDRERYGFALQIYFLNKRFKLIKEAFGDNNNVLDRSIYEDALFTKINAEDGNMSWEEYEIYLELLDNMMEELESMPKKAPDVLIYLRSSFDRVLSNIVKRGRDYEQVDVSTSEGRELLDYYARLHGEYDKWFANYDKGPKVAIDMDGKDIFDPDDWEEMLKVVKEAIDA